MTIHVPDPRKMPIKRPNKEAPKKVRVVRGTPEDDLQSGIMDLFEARKAEDVTGFAVPNGGYRSWKAARIMKRTGQKAGITDLIFLNLFGLAFFLEVKTRKGSLSREQRDFRDWLQARNIPWGVARSVEEAEAWLLKHKLIKPRPA